MSESVAAKTCRIHPTREAVARCPTCERYYCRECITEHDFRMICAGCLEALLAEGEARAAKRRKAGWMTPVFAGVQATLAVAVVWFVFFSVAELLRELPAELHSGAMFEDIMRAAMEAAQPKG